RCGLRRDLDQVEALFFSDGAGFGGSDRSVFVSVVSDQKDGLGDDFFIDAGPVFRRRRSGLLETSGNYDSLLLLAHALTLSARVMPEASRNGVRKWLWGNGPLGASARPLASPGAGIVVAPSRNNRKGCGFRKGYSAT